MVERSVAWDPAFDLKKLISCSRLPGRKWSAPSCPAGESSRSVDPRRCGAGLSVPNSSRLGTTSFFAHYLCLTLYPALCRKSVMPLQTVNNNKCHAVYDAIQPPSRATYAHSASNPARPTASSSQPSPSPASPALPASASACSCPR